MGAHKLNMTISPSGRASTAACGTFVMTPGAVTLVPTGIASTATYGMIRFYKVPAHIDYKVYAKSYEFKGTTDS